MAIRVRDRNPDINLYTKEIISMLHFIESGCGSSYAESSVADYMTDYSIQVVNISDKKKKGAAHSAAWCWVGKDSNDDCLIILISIPNSWPRNSVNASGIMLKESFDGWHIVQGDSYNDFQLGLDVVSGDMIKVGQADREDGYYLEAEMISDYE
jgi:hypothetical protein